MDIKNGLPKKPDMWFEPSIPITTAREFTDEIFKYANKENKDITILKEGLEPVISINNEKYFCMLQEPRLLNLPIPLFATHTYGFKFVYIYKY